MSRFQYQSIFLLFCLGIGIVGCTDIPTSDFYEVDGLVSGVLIDTSETSGWQPIQYINSQGLVYNSSDSVGAGPLSFSVYISNPGNYSIWILTASGYNTDSVSTVEIAVTGPEGFLQTQASAELPRDRGLTWVRARVDATTDLMSFDEPGKYTFSIKPPNSNVVQVHKIQMSLNNTDLPFGLGLPSSTRTDLSAADLFRELPVMMPPAWVFKPIIGVKGDSLSEVFSDFPIVNDNAGGMWTVVNDNAHLSDSSTWSLETEVTIGVRTNVEKNCQTGIAPLFESGYRFFVTEASPGIDCLARIHRVYQEIYGDDRRSVLFHGIKYAYNPDSKRYPAPMTPFYQFQWTAETIVQNGEFVPGGYRELVSDLVNPANSLYGMPFLSMPVDYQSGSKTLSGRDSGLFIRTIQLSPFLPVMHLIFPDNLIDEGGFSDQLSSIEKEQLTDALQLRTSLFPYHYTHAHYTRQSNLSVISGFREYPRQFMYGDAFLIAPVTEPNSDGRILFFPEGKRWYNYHSGQVYDSGQSWFVETRLDRLPMFVKAGSVIPYQMDDNQMDDNSDYLKLEIYTGDAGAFRLVEDDGVTRAYRRAEAARTMFRYNEVGGYLKLTIGAVQAGFEGMKDQRSYDIHFKFVDVPERIEVNGNDLPRETGVKREMSWHYNESDREIIVNLNNVSKHEKLDIFIHP